MVRAVADRGGDDYVRSRFLWSGSRRPSESQGLKVETDFRNEKINYKVREHSLAKVPVIIVCGMREAEERTVNVRRLGSKDQKSMGLDEAVAAFVEEATPPDLK